MTSFVHNPPKSTAKYNVGGYTNGKNGSTGTDALVQIQDLKDIIASGGTGGGTGGVTNAQLSLALQAYVKTSGATMTGQLNTVTATATANAANKSYVDSTTVSLTGDTMTGSLNMGNNGITNVRLPTNNDDVATKLYVDTKDAENDIEVQTKLSKFGDTCTGYLKMTLQPAASTDLCNKSYTDNAIATSTVFQPINSKLTTISAITPTANCVIGTDATGVVLMTPTQTRAAIDVYSVPEVTSVLANYLTLSGGTMTGKITGIQTPTNPTDAVNKEYADMLTAGLIFYPGVACYTTLSGVSFSYDGAQQISNAIGTPVVDYYTLQIGDRVLVNTTTNYAANGVYVVIDISTDTSLEYALIRATDFDGSPLGEFEQGGLFYVTNGTVYGGSLFVQISPPPTALGTSPIIYSQYSAAKSIAAGANIAITGNAIAVTPALTGITSITGLSTPVNNADAANKSYVDTQDAKFLPLAGGTMSGAINMGQKNLLNASIVQILSQSKNSVINIQQQGGGTSYYINLPASAPVINASTPTNLVLGINNSTVCTWMNPETQVYKNLLIGSGYGNSTTDTVTLTKASGSAYTLALPGAAPTANTYLQYNGTNYNWASAGSALTAGTNLIISGNEIGLKTSLTGITAITGLTNPVNAADAANKQYVDATDAANMTDINARFDAQDVDISFKLPLAGGTMTGPIDMGTHAISKVASLEFNVQGGIGDTLMLSKFPGTPYRISFPGAPPAPNTYLRYDGTNGNPIYSWASAASTLTAGSNIDITNNVVSLATTLTGITSISGLADPVNASDAVNKAYLDAIDADIVQFVDMNYAYLSTNLAAVDAAKLPLAGGTMTGPIDMGGQAITNAASIALNGVVISNTDTDGLIIVKATGGAAYTLALPAAAPAASTYLKYDGVNYAWASAGSALTAFTGASSGAAGVLGGVPAPQAGDQLKYLQANGTWSAVSGSGAVAAEYYMTTQPINKNATYNTLFEFSTTPIAFKGGAITQISTTQFQLSAGYTYKLTAALNQPLAILEATCQWSTSTTLSGVIGVAGNAGNSNQNQSAFATAYLSPTVVTTVGVVITYANGASAGNSIIITGLTFGRQSFATIEVVSNNNTITAFTGATSVANGTVGYIPAPQAGTQNSYLRGDGTWQQANNAPTSAQYLFALNTISGYYNATGAPITFATLQQQTGGGAISYSAPYSNFTLQPGYTYKLSSCCNYASAAGAYQWATNISSVVAYIGVAGDSLGVTGSPAIAYYTPTAATNVGVYGVQGGLTLTVVVGLAMWMTIEVVSNNNTITAFTGATSIADGAIGYIPKPLTGQQNYVLTGAGSWQPASTPLAYSFISMYRGGTAAANSPDVPIVTAYPGGVNDGFPFDKYTTDSPLTNPYVVVNMTGSPAVTNTNFTLTLGRTYRLSACLSFFNVVTLGTIIQYAWIAKNGGTTAFISHPGGLGSGNTAVGQNDMERYTCECVYTPTVANTVVLFTNVASNAGSYIQTLIKSSTVLSFGQCAWAKIEVIG